MHAIPRFAAVAGAAALLVALLGGCAAADSTGSDDSNSPVANPEPEPEPEPEPVETNEVRLTWVETSGASSATIVFPFDLPYFAYFEVNLDEADSTVVDSVALDTSGEFSIDNDGCTGATVAPEQPCSISLLFDVDGPGTYEATLRVTTDGGSEASIPVVIEVIADAEDDDGSKTDGTDGTDTDG